MITGEILLTQRSSSNAGPFFERKVSGSNTILYFDNNNALVALPTASLTVGTASYIAFTDVAGLSSFSSSIQTRVTTNETDISNLQTDSASFSTRVTTNETDISNLQTDSASFSTRVTDNESDIGALQTTASSQTVLKNLGDSTEQVIQGSLRLSGNITAEQFIVSSSVMYVTQSFSSGSTVFGNTLDDTHQFTGSVFITGSSLSINGNEVITVADTASMTVTSASYAISASHAELADSASRVDWENVFGRWITPAPTGSGHAVGQNGDMSYDNTFFYFKSGSRWRRTAAAEF